MICTSRKPASSSASWAVEVDPGAPGLDAANLARLHRAGVDIVIAQPGAWSETALRHLAALTFRAKLRLVEPVHPPRPGEVSVAALTTASTTFVFGDPGSVLYACHLPGHFRYGMSGTVDVSN